MEKAVVFFSHSSIDTEAINYLKERIIQFTGKAIEIFLSSDGQSIPLGSNWIHKIEEGLEKAKIMFVFISKDSINSSWIYFESGYSYSKKIKVIPVGINGADISKLRPPLSLLQGFNITDTDSMNNIISVINNELDFNFIDGFSDTDLISFSAMTSDKRVILEKDILCVDYLEFAFPLLCTDENGEQIIFMKDHQRYILDRLSEKDVIYEDRDGYIVPGMKVLFINDVVLFRIDTILLSENIDLIKSLLSEVYSKIPKTLYFRIILKSGYAAIKDEIKLSSLCSIANIKRNPVQTNSFDFGDLTFSIKADYIIGNNGKDESNYIYVVYSPDTFSDGIVRQLMSKLFDYSIINDNQRYKW